MTTTTATADTAPSSREFVKALTLTDATMLVAGSMIGSGIFIVSAEISRTVNSPFWLLMAWVVSGVVTIFGALAYGELAAMYPRAGGQYVFLRESMGHLMGFLYGWTLFVVIQTGTIAAVAVAFGKFLGVLWPSITPDRYAWFPQMDFTLSGAPVQLGLSPQRLIAVISIWVLTWINLRGVKEAKIVQTTLTVVKTGALAALILLGLTIGRHPEAIAANFSNGNFNPVAFTSGVRDRVRIRAGGLALRERRLEQRDIRRRRGSLAAEKSPARAHLRDGARLPALPSREHLLPERAAASRSAERRDGDGARDSVRDAGSGGQRRRRRRFSARWARRSWRRRF